jgi:hypothetical protein
MRVRTAARLQRSVLNANALDFLALFDRSQATTHHSCLSERASRSITRRALAKLSITNLEAILRIPDVNFSYWAR